MLSEEEQPLENTLRVAMGFERRVVTEDGVWRQLTGYEKKIDGTARDRFSGTNGEEYAALHTPDPARAQIDAQVGIDGPADGLATVSAYRRAVARLALWLLALLVAIFLILVMSITGGRW